MPLNIGYLTAKTNKESDEVYTPAYAVKPILKYVDINVFPATIWCPFDKEDSEYVKLLSAAGHKVIHSHIDDGKNFFFYTPNLQGQKRFPYIKDCQALIFDKRINYYTNLDKKEVQKGVSFGSFYLCRNFLPKDLIFERLKTEE